MSYESDPASFARDMLGIALEPWQVAILTHTSKNRTPGMNHTSATPEASCYAGPGIAATRFPAPKPLDRVVLDMDIEQARVLAQLLHTCVGGCPRKSARRATDEIRDALATVGVHGKDAFGSYSGELRTDPYTYRGIPVQFDCDFGSNIVHFKEFNPNV